MDIKITVLFINVVYSLAIILQVHNFLITAFNSIAHKASNSLRFLDMKSNLSMNMKRS